MDIEAKIERKSSIDKEPRTLSWGQIQYSREAALAVLNGKTIEEALSIFTEGLQPVIHINEGEMDDRDLSDLIGEHKSFLVLEEFRDIVSAPF